MHVDKSHCFWETVLWTHETKWEHFGKSHQLYVQRRENMKLPNKRTSSPLWDMEEVQLCDWVALLCLPLICAGHNEIRRLSRHCGGEHTKHTVQQSPSCEMPFYFKYVGLKIKIKVYVIWNSNKNSQCQLLVTTIQVIFCQIIKWKCKSCNVNDGCSFLSAWIPALLAVFVLAVLLRNNRPMMPNSSFITQRTPY